MNPVESGANEAVAGNPCRTLSVRWALGGLSMSILLASLGTSIANVALPSLAEAFDASFPEVQWVALAYLLAVTTLIVSAGRLGDIVGRRLLLLAGVSLFTAASVACSLAPSLWLLIAARAAQGLGAAVMMALTMAFVGETVPKARTGGAMGLLGTMSAIGTALGPSLGGVLIAGPGWRAIFFINVPLGIVTLLLVWRFLPADDRAEGSQRAGFDTVGTLLLALTLGAYALAMTVGQGDVDALNVGLLVAALLGLGLFLLVQTNVPSPLIRLTLFRDVQFSSSLVMNALVSTVMMATLVVGPFYLSRALGLEAAVVGMVMSVGPILSTLCGVPAGRVVDRLGARFVVAAGLVGLVLGALALTVLPRFIGLPGYIAAIAILTPGYQLFQAANNTAVMKNVPQDRRGVVSGLLNLSRNLGLISGASVMGAVFALGAASTDMASAPPRAVEAGMAATFGVAAFLMVVAVFVAVAGGTPARRPASPADAAEAGQAGR